MSNITTDPVLELMERITTLERLEQTLIGDNQLSGLAPQTQAEHCRALTNIRRNRALLLNELRVSLRDECRTRDDLDAAAAELKSLQADEATLVAELQHLPESEQESRSLALTYLRLRKRRAMFFLLVNN